MTPEKLLELHNAYRRLFLNDDGKLKPDAEVVMKELMKFCRWWTSTTTVSPSTRTVDPYASFQAEGRREVMARILERLYIDDSILFKLYHQRNEPND